MFCDYCLQLLDFSRGVTPHAPQEKPLGGDTRPLSRNQINQRAEAPALRMKIHEDDSRSDYKTLWWKAPVHQTESPQLLSHSPDGNCTVCNMIFSNVSATIVEALRRSRDIGNIHFVYRLDKARSLSIWLEVDSHLLPMIDLNLTYATANETSGLFSIGESANTKSIGSSVLVASWLEHCLANHPQCKRRSGNQSRPPSRLIDVGSAIGFQAPCLWSPGTTAVTYVTLSHRWGNREPLTLTKASFAAMSVKIEVGMLSQTSQDAIAITRSLGLRYLWIDSLCIIQDDVIDWQTESANMGEIFKSSLFTIAASWASSQTEGCFFDRGSLYAKLPLPKGTQVSYRALNDSALATSHSERPRLSRHRSLERVLPTDRLDLHTSAFSSILERRDGLKSTSLSSGSRYPSASSTFGHLEDGPVALTSRRTKSDVAIGENPEQFAPNIPIDRNRKHLHSDAAPHISDQFDENEDSVKVSFHPKSETTWIGAEPRYQELDSLYIVPSQRGLWLHSVELSPLNRRAWVLQERLLSPRTVYYTKTQLFWECRESKACESSAVPIPKFEVHWDGSLKYLNSLHKLHGPSFEPWHLHWPEIVERYTDTSRTKLEDKLVAISGLAREIESITNDKYCAGIWRKDIVSQVLWRLNSPQHEINLPFQAPSWSWASTEGTIAFQRRVSGYVTPELDIISIQSIGIDGKPWSFGQIEYGSLRARGVLRSALRSDRHGQGYKLLLTDQLDEELDANEGDYYPDTAPGNLPENALCLPIARISSGASLGEDENSVHGIVAGIVVEPSGEFAGEYRRLGFFRVSESAGVVWFGLNDKRELWDITLI